MSLFRGMNTSASALTANRLRLDTISSNIAQANTTRSRIVNGVVKPEHGVKVTAIREDQTPFQRVYNPEHPDANAEGYVLMPNVDIMKEMVDMISAQRSYEANATAFNATKSMMMKAFEINGR